MTQRDADHSLFETQCQPSIEDHMFGVECATISTSWGLVTLSTKVNA